MSRLPLAEPETLTGTLRHLHDASPEEDWSTKHTARVFGAAPELLESYFAGFYSAWHGNAGELGAHARLHPRVKELMRLRIAQLNACQTCMAARLAPDDVAETEIANPDYSPAEATAVRFAEQLATDHHAITDADVAALREHFDDAETLELLMMAGQYIGFGRVLATLQLEDAACPVPAG